MLIGVVDNSLSSTECPTASRITVDSCCMKSPGFQRQVGLAGDLFTSNAGNQA